MFYPLQSTLMGLVPNHALVVLHVLLKKRKGRGATLARFPIMGKLYQVRDG